MSFNMGPLTPVTDVGIGAMELYFPQNYIDQADLEKYNKVSSGKYTIGLGQQQMGFCADNEDIVSISMTVTRNLLETYEILTDSIGCLVVGTETLIDKSKSVKTALMDLFPGNSDIEGVDIKNACFGGAQALLHAIDWVTVNHQMDNKNAIVVIADIAIYEDGPARCTGGAGAIAFLICPDAAIPIDRQFAACHMKNTWDFFKPISSTSSEYPVVDGSLSLASYLEAVRMTYTHFMEKLVRHGNKDVSIESFDALFFHSPFTKMVQKGLAVMHYTDAVLRGEKLNGVDTETKLDENDRASLAKMIELSTLVWKNKTDPYLIFNRRIGNMYTPSLFAQLLAYLASDNCTTEGDKNVLFFAYGSGLASAVFPGRVRRSSSNLEKLREVALSAIKRLDQRHRFTAEEFTETLKLRETFLHSNEFPRIPNGTVLFPNTFCLTSMDELYRRKYAITECEVVNGNGVHS
uniref:Hydroxymethylglutaryl-CoA synthase n=2 Tax=Caenorhabditis japonica TaxID=281687 RepID=A0A8R1DGF0_CAEJA